MMRNLVTAILTFSNESVMYFYLYQGSLHHGWGLLKMGPAVLSFKCGQSRYKLDTCTYQLHFTKS